MDYTAALREYYRREAAAVDALDLEAVSRVMNVLEVARAEGHRVFVCGNGGSAATASHFCCDFNKGVSMDARPDEPRYDFECLSDNVPTMMAIGNDVGYDDVFALPLASKMSEGDVVVGISGSGNSENVVRALAYAKEHGGVTVGIVGYGGGRIKGMVDECVHVGIDNMQIVEDVHMSLDHSMMYVLSHLGEFGLDRD